MLSFRQRMSDLASRTSARAWAGFTVTLGFCGLAAMIVAGYTLTDPGGATGLGLTVLWLVPLIALAGLALYRPDIALPLLVVGTLLPLGFGVWSLVDYAGARDWEDQRGPVQLVFVLMVAIPLAVEGLARPRIAGWMLIGLVLVPLALSVIGAGSDWGLALSIGMLTSPVLLGGLLYVFAGTSRGSLASGPA